VSSGPSLRLDSRPFGTTHGLDVDLYRLAAGALEISILTYGGIVQALRVPDRAGETANVVLGFPGLDGYLIAAGAYLGPIIGRYANRIARGEFELDGTRYRLSRNEGENHLHGGVAGFNTKVWRAETRESEREVAVALSLESPDGDEGYPGALDVEVTYSLDADGVFRIDFRATTTRPTVISLTSHPLFNLAGKGAGSVLDHELEIDADAYVAVDAELIPTGELVPVEGTPLDFRRARPIAGAFDHCFVLNGGPTRLVDPRSGRALEIRTTEPGLQLYTGNHRGVALETQRLPDSPNHANFPSPVLRPGEVFESTTELRFSVT
jgi:aldose 1-epimerase